MMKIGSKKNGKKGDKNLLAFIDYTRLKISNLSRTIAHSSIMIMIDSI